jgi:hypothetical protein
MINNFYYYEIIRRTSAAFGTIFNEIYVRHQDNEGEDYSYIKVPIAYGPIQKFLSRIEQKEDLRNRVAITLPRMSFQVGQLSYDSSRKTSNLQTFNTTIGPNNTPKQLYMPVPYNLPFELTIATKYTDDMFQIVEQILPIFRPEYTITVNLASTIGEKLDIPLVLNSISPFQDEYEGNYDSRRFITATLSFSAKIAFYGKVDTDSNGNIIKKVQVDYYTNTDRINASRQRRYVVTPKATKDYDKDESLQLLQNITEDDKKFNVSNPETLNVGDKISINSEVIEVKSIDNNEIVVNRGQNNTNPTFHQDGDYINIIDELDDELVLPTDEYDFNEETFDFDDGLIFSPRKGIDI